MEGPPEQPVPKTESERASYERAKELVREARMLVEAGLSGEYTKADVREGLDDFYAMATREADPEATAYIRGELEKLAPVSEMEQIVESKLAEAAAARPIDAVGILTGAMLGPKYKRLSPEQRARIEKARDEYSAKWKAERAAKK